MDLMSQETDAIIRLKRKRIRQMKEEGKLYESK